MITLPLEVPDVRACDENRCAYNVARACHARAITIGDGENPMCDTFFVSGTHARNTRTTAGVGACKVNSCHHNEDFECQAGHIYIETPNGMARCMTYSA